jgi:hypothetical protein
VQQTASFTQAQLRTGYINTVISQLGGAPQCGVKLYSVKYETVGVHGEPATANAGLFVPDSQCVKKRPYTMIAYAQGTNVNEAQRITKPTSQNVEPDVLAAIFAAHGYVLSATEYLGLGLSNYTYQPYLVASAEASAVIDATRASRAAAGTLGVPLANKIYLTGYSQGGHSILATQKAMEAAYGSQFAILADAPNSGPYALTQTLLDGVSHPGQSAPIFSAYILTGYQKTYGNVYEYSRPITAFQRPYQKWINTLLPVESYAQANKLNGVLLPKQLHRLLQPAFVAAFSKPTSGAYKDVAANDLLDGWTPKAPVYFCGGSRDPEVEFKNSRLAYAYFKKRGATVSLRDVNSLIPKNLPMDEYHDAVLLFCHTLQRVQILDGGTPPSSVRLPPGSLKIHLEFSIAG